MELNPSRDQILAEYSRTRRELGDWLAGATAEDLRRKSNGTKWTNEELLDDVYADPVRHFDFRARQLSLSA